MEKGYTAWSIWNQVKQLTAEPRAVWEQFPQSTRDAFAAVEQDATKVEISVRMKI